MVKNGKVIIVETPFSKTAWKVYAHKEKGDYQQLKTRQTRAMFESKDVQKFGYWPKTGNIEAQYDFLKHTDNFFFQLKNRTKRTDMKVSKGDKLFCMGYLIPNFSLEIFKVTKSKAFAKIEPMEQYPLLKGGYIIGFKRRVRDNYYLIPLKSEDAGNPKIYFDED